MVQTPAWTRSSPADVYYQRDTLNPRVMKATPRISVLADRFENDILKRGERALCGESKYEPPSRKVILNFCFKHTMMSHNTRIVSFSWVCATVSHDIYLFILGNTLI